MPAPAEEPKRWSRGWHRGLLRAAALGIIALAGTGVAVAAADSSGTTAPASTDPVVSTTATATITSTAAAQPVAPAPAGFAASLVTIYSDQYSAVTALDSASSSLSTQQLPDPSSFEQNVDALTPDELAEIYAASQKDANWDQLSGALSTIDSQAHSYASSASVRSAMGKAARSSAASAAVAGSGSAASSRASAAASSGGSQAADATTGTTTGTFPPTSPTTTIAAPPSTFTPSNAVEAAQLQTCPDGAPGGPTVAPGDDAIYAAQLTTDVAASLADDVPETIEIAGESYPDPAKYVAEALVLAGSVTLDTLNYYQGVANDCDAGNDDSYLANIDNTTQQLYTLESDYIQPTVDAIETGLGTIHQQVQDVQTSVDEALTIDIEQALSSTASSSSGSSADTAPPNIEFMLPAAHGGQLDSTPVGVQEVVTNAVSQAHAAGLAVNAMVTRDLAAANTALAAGQYRNAYDEYQAAYQGLG